MEVFGNAGGELLGFQAGLLDLNQLFEHRMNQAGDLFAEPILIALTELVVQGGQLSEAPQDRLLAVVGDGCLPDLIRHHRKLTVKSLVHSKLRGKGADKV
jgi:hypothetical protein